MKALVTGAAGFIGSYLVEALVERGYEVTCLARKTSNLRWIEHLNLKYIFCDLADVEACADEIKQFDYVFHVAGLTKAASKKDFFFVNTQCTKNLLGAAANSGRLKRFVYVSSLAAAGPSRDGTPVREDMPPGPVSFYGKSKLSGEEAVLQYSAGMPVTVIRPPAVYGPRDTDLLVMFRLIKKGFFPYWGKCYYSLLYVEDLVSGILLAAERDDAAGKTFFLSDDMVYTNEEIAAEIASALGAKPVKVRLPRFCMPAVAYLGEKIDKKGIINRDKVRELFFSYWTCDPGRATSELGFRPKIMLREGIKWTADWYRIHRWL